MYASALAMMMSVCAPWPDTRMPSSPIKQETSPCASVPPVMRLDRVALELRLRAGDFRDHLVTGVDHAVAR